MAHIYPICDEDCFEIALTRIFPRARADELAAHAGWLCPDHLDATCSQVRLGMKSWLIDTGTTRILVDTCIGQHKLRPNHPAWNMRADARLLRELAARGYAPEEIDIVMCTHLHADHVGWNTRLENGRWVPTFPNARYAMSRREFDTWKALSVDSEEPVNHGAFLDSILPIEQRGQALFVQAGDALAQGLVIESLAGHTFDHFGLRLARTGGDALFCGDAIHSPLQLVRPEWTSAFCGDPAQAIATRRAMLARAAQDGTVLYPAHFRGAAALRVARDGDVFRPLWLAGEADGPGFVSATGGQQ